MRFSAGFPQAQEAGCACNHVRPQAAAFVGILHNGYSLPAGAGTLTPSGPLLHPDTWHFSFLQPSNCCSLDDPNSAPPQEHHPLVRPWCLRAKQSGASGAALSPQASAFCREAKAGRQELCRRLPATKAGGRGDACSSGCPSSSSQCLNQGIIHTFPTHSNTAPAKAR